MTGGGRRRTALLAAALLLTTLAGCGDKEPAASGPAKTESSSATPSDGATTEPAVGTTDNAVDPPGPRKGPLVSADLLVFSQDTLTPGMVRRIAAIKGVRDVEQLSMAQVSIENEALNLAAVDAGTYRNYTPRASAELQEEWDRVAAGQLALPPNLKKKLPTKDGYLTLGNGQDAPRIAVGAYAPQIPVVDAVVNAKVGEALGMPPGNALIVSTDALVAPASKRQQIAQIAGDRASVQRLDIAALRGLDIHVKQTALLVGTVAQAVGIFNYTVLGGGHIAPDPSWVASHIVTTDVPILGQVTCNKVMIEQLRAALQDVIEAGLADAIHPSEYAGCYYPRFIAGTTKLSNHSFGLALDLNVPGNQRGTVGEMDRGVVAIFEHWGFTWGGRWSYTDPMHFEMNAIVHVG
jgi:D-alanyl-D-alanine carboxypeptidase